MDMKELTAIVKFTFEGSFDSHTIYEKMPELASGDEPILMFEGIKGENKYRYMFKFLDLYILKREGRLSEFLLKERDRVFQDNR